MLLPSLILLSIMTDWGRVVNIAYTFSILTYIYLIKNNLVTIEKKSFYYFIFHFCIWMESKNSDDRRCCNKLII